MDRATTDRTTTLHRSGQRPRHLHTLFSASLFQNLWSRLLRLLKKLSHLSPQHDSPVEAGNIDFAEYPSRGWLESVT